MEIIGYITAILIGISLGLIGGGGAILTVPILVYFFKVPPVQATAYSLFVVGCSSTLGGWQKWRKGEVSFPNVWLFGLPSLATVYLFRQVIVPLIPDPIFSLGSYTVPKNTFILVLFACLMLLSAIAMLKKRKPLPSDLPHELKAFRMIIQGILVGIVCGLLGAGGGFIIIPSLVLFARLDMRIAIGTSLVIIAINSLIGFTGDLYHTQMDWLLLLPVTALALVGIFIGNYCSKFISTAKLKKGFGFFVLFMGLYILWREIGMLG